MRWVLISGYQLHHTQDCIQEVDMDLGTCTMCKVGGSSLAWQGLIQVIHQVPGNLVHNLDTMHVSIIIQYRYIYSIEIIFENPIGPSLTMLTVNVQLCWFWCPNAYILRYFPNFPNVKYSSLKSCISQWDGVILK